MSVAAAFEAVRFVLQGEVKPALTRLQESRAARARELSDEALAVQERLDGCLEALTERTEENALLGTQVSPTQMAKLECTAAGLRPFPSYRLLTCLPCCSAALLSAAAARSISSIIICNPEQQQMCNSDTVQMHKLKVILRGQTI